MWEPLQKYALDANSNSKRGTAQELEGAAISNTALVASGGPVLISLVGSTCLQRKRNGVGIILMFEW